MTALLVLVACGTALAWAAAPTVEVEYSPESPVTGEEVTFEANANVEDGTVEAYEWRIDGEVVSDSRTFAYTFEEAGDHEVEVTVTDDEGNTATRLVTVTVQEANRKPTVSIADRPEEAEPGHKYTFRGQADDPDGTIVSYEWRVDGEVVSDSRAFAYTFEETGEYEVTLVATDNGSATASATETVRVAERTPTPAPTAAVTPDGDDGTSFPLPGFGVAAAVVALVVAFALRRRSS